VSLYVNFSVLFGAYLVALIKLLIALPAPDFVRSLVYKWPLSCLWCFM